jgi:hypothetical protein
VPEERALKFHVITFYERRHTACSLTNLTPTAEIVVTNCTAICRPTSMVGRLNDGPLLTVSDESVLILQVFLGAEQAFLPAREG